MHWRLKAFIQKGFAALPKSIGSSIYEKIQVIFGQTSKTTVYHYLNFAKQVAERIHCSGGSLCDRSVFEIGTGKRLVACVGFWLCGAKKIYTIDLNRLVDDSMFYRDLEAICRDADAVYRFLGQYAAPDFAQRISALESVRYNKIEDIFNVLNLEYNAPCFAESLAIQDDSIDYYTSCTVLEHVPPHIMTDIFIEADRILKPSGKMIHYIDYADHLAHQDSRIPYIHFLRFAEKKWLRIAGNRYAYHNRLRVDDFIAIVKNAGFEIDDNESQIDQRSLMLLKSGSFSIDREFQSKSHEINATINSWIIASPSSGH